MRVRLEDRPKYHTRLFSKDTRLFSLKPTRPPAATPTHASFHRTHASFHLTPTHPQPHPGAHTRLFSCHTRPWAAFSTPQLLHRSSSKSRKQYCCRYHILLRVFSTFLFEFSLGASKEIPVNCQRRIIPRIHRKSQSIPHGTPRTDYFTRDGAPLT